MKFPAQNKFRNVPTQIGDLQFASRKEARRWGDLCLLERAGMITDLKAHPAFPLDVNGVPVCRYVADASYVEGGVLVVEDTKSPITRKHPVYRLKNKLFAAIHGFQIREV
jgi:hypothetical protein